MADLIPDLAGFSGQFTTPCHGLKSLFAIAPKRRITPAGRAAPR
jgi:hypothetical protein